MNVPVPDKLRKLMSFTGTFYCERPLGLANAVSTANGVLGWFFLLR